MPPLRSTPPPPMEPGSTPPAIPEAYTRRSEAVLNERLNTSEMMALERHGKEKIDAETAYFQQRTQADPRLWAELYSKPHPYQWMIDNNATARLHRGNSAPIRRYDEGARRSMPNDADPLPRLRAASMPPSLASARSAAPRGSNGFAGPLSMEDILTRPKRSR